MVVVVAVSDDSMRNKVGRIVNGSCSTSQGMLVALGVHVCVRERETVYVNAFLCVCVFEQKVVNQF